MNIFIYIYMYMLITYAMNLYIDYDVYNMIHSGVRFSNSRETSALELEI